MLRDVALGVVLAVTASGHVAQAQTGWAHVLEWEHDGTGVTAFRLCVGSRCDAIDAQRAGGATWRAPLPLLAAGEHRLSVEACNAAGCSASRPALIVRVTPVAAGPAVTPVPPPPQKTKNAQFTGGRAVPRNPD
jgi:hypothetical protein